MSSIGGARGSSSASEVAMAASSGSTPGVIGHVEPEADDHAVGGKLFHEDAANFFRSDQNIVGPAQAGRGQAESAQGGDDGESCGEGKGGPTAVGRIEGEDNRHPQSSLIRDPTSSLPAAGGGLGARTDGVPRGQVARVVIGGSKAHGFVERPTAPLAAGKKSFGSHGRCFGLGLLPMVLACAGQDANAPSFGS
jgi:hypothetical protein